MNDRASRSHHWYNVDSSGVRPPGYNGGICARNVPSEATCLREKVKEVINISVR